MTTRRWEDCAVRVLMVNKFYDLRGGAERVLFDLSEELRRRDHEVIPFATRDARNLPSAWSTWFAAHRNYDRPRLAERITQALGVIYDFGARRSLGALLDAVRPDVAHLHNIYHQLSPSILDELHDRRIPTVLTLHDYKLACPVYRLFRGGQTCTRCVGRSFPLWCGVHTCSRGSRMESWLLSIESTFHRLRRSYERTVDVFVAPSAFMGEIMRRQGLPPERLVVIPNATAQPGRSTDSAERDPTPTVLFVGRLSEEKGIDVLLRAAAQLPELQLRVAGDGPLRSRLARLAENHANVHLLGPLEDEALRRERARAWAVALPSIWYENAPLSLLEAYASARPVLAAAHGGLLELVRDDDTGWLLPPGDLASWVEGLRRVSTHREQLATMGDSAHRFLLEHHDFDRFVDRYEGLYRRLAGAAGALRSSEVR
jgi:glycosyltransferase involved in cell wall biosynthesis